VEDTTLRDYWRHFLNKAWFPGIVSRSPGKNLALGKPANQSSISNWSRGKTPQQDAARVVSGVFYGRANCHTDRIGFPWWQVNLEDRYLITEVRIFNRLGQLSVMNRASRLAILVSTEGEGWHTAFLKNDNAIFGGVDGIPLFGRQQHQSLPALFVSSC
jgi:hypothetical protein